MAKQISSGDQISSLPEEPERREEEIDPKKFRDLLKIDKSDDLDKQQKRRLSKQQEEEEKRLPSTVLRLLLTPFKLLWGTRNRALPLTSRPFTASAVYFLKAPLPLIFPKNGRPPLSQKKR